MANTRSAQKDIKKNRRNYLKNKYHLGRIRGLENRLIQEGKAYRNADDQKKSIHVKEASKLFSKLQSAYDKAVKCKVLHKNVVSRKRSQLSICLLGMEVFSLQK
jgi:ribosomal protein S20